MTYEEAQQKQEALMAKGQPTLIREEHDHVGFYYLIPCNWEDLND